MTDNEILNLILEKVSNLESEMQTVNGRLDKVESKIDKVENRLDKVESKLETMHVWQKKNTERLEELKVSQKLFELNANKKFARLQDGLDTVEEILKLNDLIPR